MIKTFFAFEPSKVFIDRVKKLQHSINVSLCNLKLKTINLHKPYIIENSICINNLTNLLKLSSFCQNHISCCHSFFTLPTHPL